MIIAAAKKKKVFPLCLGFILLTLFSGLLPPSSIGAGSAVTESQIKAVYLYNFLHFITWPDNFESSSNGTPVSIGVLGSSPVGKALDELAATISQSKRRPITIQHYQNDNDINNCQILFFSPMFAPNVKEISQNIKNSLLTVGDTNNFLAAGGMINLVTFQGKIRYTINRAATKAAGIHINSQLLKTALKVVDKSEKQNKE